MSLFSNFSVTIATSDESRRASFGPRFAANALFGFAMLSCIIPLAIFEDADWRIHEALAVCAIVGFVTLVLLALYAVGKLFYVLIASLLPSAER